jgi:hypothetical protein
MPSSTRVQATVPSYARCTFRGPACGSFACWAKNKYDCKGVQTLKRKFVKDDLHAANQSDFATAATTGDGLEIYLPFVQLAAEVCDGCALGDDIWLSLGATKSRTAFTLVLHTPEGPVSVYGPTFQSVCEHTLDLL